MQRCPKCGYRDAVNWPMVFWVVAFGLLYIVFILTSDNAPRSYRLAGLLAYLLFMAGTIWKNFREGRNRREYLKQHPSPTERVKAHIRPSPPIE